MYGALHRKSNVDRFYIKRKEGGRSLMSIECCVRKEESSFTLPYSEENLIRGVIVAETINIEDTVANAEFKKQKAQEFKQNWSE